MTKTTRWVLISNLAFVSLIATIVAVLLFRTDADRIAQEVRAKIEDPYATMAIVPESLAQHPIKYTSNWGLFFSMRMTKKVTCDEIRVQRVVQRIGHPTPVANNTDISTEVVPGDVEDQLVEGLHVRMHGPLGPGDYLVVLISTCLLIDDAGVRTPLLGKAETYICFRVPPGPDGTFVEEPFQPISENCTRELSQVRVRPWSRYLASGR